MANSQDKLIVTSSFYQGTATAIVVGSTILAGKTAGSTVTATADGSYLNVWNNNKTDGSFGVTSPVFISFLDSEYGNLQQTINLSDIAARQGYKFVTSFSSKSELAVNLSTDGKSLTLMGYGTTQGQIDISNSNTPDVVDPTNPTVGIATPTYRNVAQINPDEVLPSLQPMVTVAIMDVLPYWMQTPTLILWWATPVIRELARQTRLWRR